MPLLSSYEQACVTSLKALLANLRGNERGLLNENLSNLVYFASLGTLAFFLIHQSIFRIFLRFLSILEYFFNIKRYNNKTKIHFSNNLCFGLWG